MENIVGLKELRQNFDTLEEKWEEIIDFTKICKGGVSMKEILSRL